MNLRDGLWRIFWKQLKDGRSPAARKMEDAIGGACLAERWASDVRNVRTMRELDLEDAAAYITEATTFPVRTVRLIEPREVDRDLPMWPTSHSLWERPVLDALISAHPDASVALAAMQQIVVRELELSTKHGVRKNFYRVDGAVQDDIIARFGHVLADTCVNLLAYTAVGEYERALRTEHVRLLFVQNPFMARDPWTRQHSSLSSPLPSNPWHRAGGCVFCMSEKEKAAAIERDG